MRSRLPVHLLFTFILFWSLSTIKRWHIDVYGVDNFTSWMCLQQLWVSLCGQKCDLIRAGGFTKVLVIQSQDGEWEDLFIKLRKILGSAPLSRSFLILPTVRAETIISIVGKTCFSSFSWMFQHHWVKLSTCTVSMCWTFLKGLSPSVHSVWKWESKGQNWGWFVISQTFWELILVQYLTLNGVISKLAASRAHALRTDFTGKQETSVVQEEVMNRMCIFQNSGIVKGAEGAGILSPECRY